MPLPADNPARVRPMDEAEVERIRKDMETRRLDMLKLVEDSKAKFKLLLQTKLPKHPEETKRPARKPPAK
jgi:formiminotetrahydrofolate cyclodeaminase